LRHEAKRRIGEYSKGMARRIGLAQALINDPEFLILDEPTSGLDPIGTRQIKDVIRSLGNKGKTILLSSHILSDVEDVCDRVMILYGGQERAAGDIGELLRQADATQITAPALDEDTIAEVRALVQRREHKDLISVSNPRVKLEDYFLRIVREAHAANLQTSGARLGGRLPEFLRHTGESTTEQVVESLVSAAGPSPVAETTAPVAAAADRRGQSEESSAVIEQLLVGSGEAAATESASALNDTGGDRVADTEGDSRIAEPTERRDVPQADASVINDLLGQASVDPKPPPGA
ncbi:MAG: ATP-binding cassette domain-containing protein, partial [Dehalococcoidia bacterium]